MNNIEIIKKLKKYIKKSESCLIHLEPEGFIYKVIRHRQLELELQLLELEMNEKTGN